MRLGAPIPHRKGTINYKSLQSSNPEAARQGEELDKWTLLVSLGHFLAKVTPS